MEGVSIVSTELLQTIIMEIRDLRNEVKQMNQERKDQSAPYLTTKQLCNYISKSRNWVMTHKNVLGCSKETGTLLFKRADVDALVDSGYFKK